MEDYRYWLALKWVPGVGDVLYRRLINTFDLPEAVFAASEASLKSVSGMTQEAVHGILTFTAFSDIDKELESVDKAKVTLLCLSDTGYPRPLLNLYDPPPVLYVKGTLDQAPAVGVVGSRRATSYGRSAAERISRGLAEAGVTVISGLAEGIDAAAHRATLAVKGRTVAVLGSGINRVYPSHHDKLAEDIAVQGAVISEFAMNATPRPQHFPRRNRIISGLSLGCVIVEASLQGGALITARCCADQGREVFAVPGSIFSNTSAGPHQLIASGAKLVKNAADILEEILPQWVPQSEGPATAQTTVMAGQFAALKTERTTKIQALSPEESEIYHRTSSDPIHIDQIIESMAWADPSVTSVASGVLGILLALEMKGMVLQLPGKFFVKVEG